MMKVVDLFAVCFLTKWMLLNLTQWAFNMTANNMACMQFYLYLKKKYSFFFRNIVILDPDTS